METITLKQSQRSSVSIEELRNIIAANHELDKDCIQIDGWLTTVDDINRFAHGGISQNIYDGPVVSFKDKYGRLHTGILTNWSISTTLYGKVVDLTVKTTIGSIIGGKLYCDNYAVDAKQLTILSGTMPEQPTVSDKLKNLLDM